jgi:hypothetical protein
MQFVTADIHHFAGRRKRARIVCFAKGLIHTARKNPDAEEHENSDQDSPEPPTTPARSVYRLLHGIFSLSRDEGITFACGLALRD